MSTFAVLSSSEGNLHDSLKHQLLPDVMCSNIDAGLSH